MTATVTAEVSSDAQVRGGLSPDTPSECLHNQCDISSNRNRPLIHPSVHQTESVDEIVTALNFPVRTVR
jgi:hypothetical protein